MGRFDRFMKIIGEEQLEELQHKTVLVLGCGGVGGYVVEALARSNIGSIILVDYDLVEETNINRQIIALTSTIGQKKIDVLEERIHAIHPDCKVLKMDTFILPENIEELFSFPFDFLFFRLLHHASIPILFLPYVLFLASPGLFDKK